MILEMPVFARGVPIGRPAFTALSWLFTAVGPVLGTLRPVLSRVPVPPGAYELAQFREILTADHRSEVALLRGLLREEPPPGDMNTLQQLVMPTLFVGHAGDPLHVLDDVIDAAERMPNTTVVTAATFFDYRFRPDRLAAEVRAFLETYEL
jgi:hypothetical protein